MQIAFKSGRAAISTINRGFSLLELMISVAIVGIVSAVALPSYQSYVLESHRIEAISALSDLYLQQISYFQENYHFAAQASLTVPATDYYTIAVTSPSAAAAATSSTFTITATAKGNQTSDTKCKVFTITQLNAKTSVDSGGADSSGECW